MSRVAIPVSRVEFDGGGHTLWVHNAAGATVLRIKRERAAFRVKRGWCENICSHADVPVTVPTGARASDCDVIVCLGDDACDPMDL